MPEAHAARALEVLKAHPLGRGAALIGRALAEGPGEVRIRSRLDGTRLLDLLSGEQMPRIC